MSTTVYKYQTDWYKMPWDKLPWKKIRRTVWKLQTRVYRATKEGDLVKARKLQRLVISSNATKFLAVKKVTQENQGKRTAGIDGLKSLTPKQRLKMAQKLGSKNKTSPVRRIWIPKPDKAEKRALGIPTMEDRARQAVVLLALEPMWEAKFEPNSYGFRPGRSTWDAIEAIFKMIVFKGKYVLDADIKQCFDQLNHQVLLQKLGSGKQIRQSVKAWLKAGILDGKTLFHPKHGTPQGGVISPLLANIALHGMEEMLQSTFPKSQRPRLIRYADDLVVLHPKLKVIIQTKEILEEWLARIGLEMNQEKTRITHTLQKYGGNVGFDFLGFTIRQHKVGRSHSGKSTNGKPLGFKTIITPSRSAMKRHLRAIQKVIQQNKSSTQEQLINKLNPMIRGWSNYYRTVVSKKIFGHIDNILFNRLWTWSIRRHPTKPKKWIAKKYWFHSSQWRFSSSNLRLLRYSDQPIKRHIKVRGSESPFNSSSASYWSRRSSKWY